eukprot:CAMPEP_0168734412 /NCGR_PEP_ID=MMETSP0724-20121128/8800_1 /TAXON_ID=265536 /ORGANISM="Amphiprora sp., Strain CCMP467" /LENGTH=213 /DNA_ID=CAMNT_0008781515 /DNA_START=29 /DNA_END=671 /DNA_ORIENTATION=+
MIRFRRFALPLLCLMMSMLIGMAQSYYSTANQHHRSEKGDATTTPQEDSTTTTCRRHDNDTAARWNDLLLTTFVYFAGTLETLLRAFALGFGGHLLLYMTMQNPSATYEQLKERFRVSLMCGVAMGCVVFGSSLMVPANLRSQWFESTNQKDDRRSRGRSSSFDSQLPSKVPLSRLRTPQSDYQRARTEPLTYGKRSTPTVTSSETYDGLCIV